MASIIVEDGTQVSGANSYVSEADLTTYGTDRGITITGNTDELLIQAMDYIESLGYIGLKLTDTQPLQWPRADAILDGYAVDVDTIPQLLIDALCEVALAIDAGNSPLANLSRKTVRERVGEIEVEYSSGSASSTIVRKINAKLHKLLASSPSGLSFKVSRA